MKKLLLFASVFFSLNACATYQEGIVTILNRETQSFEYWKGTVKNERVISLKYNAKTGSEQPPEDWAFMDFAEIKIEQP